MSIHFVAMVWYLDLALLIVLKIFKEVRMFINTQMGFSFSITDGKIWRSPHLSTLLK